MKPVTPKRTYYKHELAALANRSPSSITRYFRQHRAEYQALGIMPGAQTLHGKALQKFCDEYCIDLPECIVNELDGT